MIRESFEEDYDGREDQIAPKENSDVQFFNLFLIFFVCFLHAIITVYKELDLYFTDYLKGISFVEIIIN